MSLFSKKRANQPWPCHIWSQWVVSKDFWNFHPDPWENVSNLTSTYFSNRLKTPASKNNALKEMSVFRRYKHVFFKKLDPKLVPERAQHSGGKMWREVNRPYFFFSHSRALRKFDVTQPRPAYQVWPAATVWYMKNFVYHWFPCFVTALFIAKAMASKWVETWYRNGV